MNGNPCRTRGARKIGCNPHLNRGGRASRNAQEAKRD